MVTFTKAKEVELAVESELHEFCIGSGLRRDGNSWMVVLYLEEEAPVGVIPKDRDGVKIISEVIGVIEPQ